MKWPGGDQLLVSAGALFGNRFVHREKILPGGTTGNFVQTNGDSSGGIISLGDGIAILGNRIEVKGGSKSSGITHIGSNSFIARNKIDGFGASAMRALPWKNRTTSSNTFAWNDITEFKASAADFLCIGDKNAYIGSSCKVVDKGIGNMMLTKY